MSAQIETLEDCASNYGVFEVQGSTGKYRIYFNGSEQKPHCECKAFEFKGDCKHIQQIWDKACMYNPQWCDGKEKPELRPIDYTYESFSSNPCPSCGGKMVYVRRAV